MSQSLDSSHETPRPGDALGRAPTDVFKTIRQHPQGEDALESLATLDGKCSSIISFIGIMIAAVLIFATRDEPFAASVQMYAVYGALALLTVAGFLVCTCLYMIDVPKVYRALGDADAAVALLLKTLRHRRARYVAGFYLTLAGVALSAVAVAASL